MQGLYIAGNSRLHRLHPLTKLLAAALLILTAYLLPWLLAPALLYLALLGAALLGGVALSFLRVSLGLLLPIALSLFLIQGILFPPANAAPLELGPLTLRREGLIFAFRTATQLLALTSALVLLFETTHPADLVFALTERGLPRSIGYVLLVSLQLLPYMQSRATAISEAQRSRGLETEGSLLRRVRSLIPLVGPLVIGALSEVEERAIALELRAFMLHGPKTSLRQLVDSAAQRIARALLLLAALALLAWKLWRLLFA